ncbi:hypothetical protein [Actinoalloteichus caeruleus]|uniref:hypothetical protein n=1 Tax=Actinoalloteichus cyanogriseus TaxID=2893586 RepID=UPI0004AA6972|nr:hypothetical protein [Actinoalloteichus caeruleus]
MSWHHLPEHVRDVVRTHLGPVVAAHPVRAGQSADVASVLGTAAGPDVFLKAVRGVSKRMRWLRNEITAAPLTGGLAPAVLMAEDVGEWLVVVFEHVPGRAANLSPGSPDLPLVAEVVNRIGQRPGSGLKPLRVRWGVTDWWYRLAAEAPDAVVGWDTDEAVRWASRFPGGAEGDRLAHTDLHGEQFLIEASVVRVVDWGYPGCGAAWVDPAFLVLRLVEAGHTPHEAETWARTHLSHFVDDERLTAFATHIAGLWGYWAVTGDISGAHGRARLARDYASWRLALTRGE